LTDSKQIFISYSRKDTAFVDQLKTDFTKAGLDIWLDTEDLTPGTPNWEQAIRDAIDNAAAVVLVASPDSRASVYVQGELTLAKLRQHPIYPVWAAGDNWIDAATLDLVNYQYVDCRGAEYKTGIKTIIGSLKKFWDISEGNITLGLPTHEIVEINIAQFDKVYDILNHIYLNYLQDWYPEMAYGSEWILVNVHTRQIAAPWTWLTFKVDDNLALFRMYEQTQARPLADFGIFGSGHWGVCEAKRVRPAGFLLNSETAADRLLSQYGMRELSLFRSEGCLTTKPIEDAKPSDYQHAFILSLTGSQHIESRVAFVETDKICE